MRNTGEEFFSLCFANELSKRLMAQCKKRSKRKSTGGRYHPSHKKKARDTGETPVHTKLGAESKTREKRVRGGRKAKPLIIASHANVAMKSGKIEKSKIINVVENTAGRTFVRQGIITKGAIVKVSKGLARVTSKPTRDGVVNAILLK